MVKTYMERCVEIQRVSWKGRFFTLWGAQFFSLLSSSIVQFAIVWWISSNTGSAKILGVATIITMLPESILNPFIGALVDRGNRRLIIIASDLGAAFCSVLLAAVFYLNSIQLWHIYVALFARSVFSCFHKNSMISSTSLLVPDNHLIRIAGLNQTLEGMMMFLTPAMGAMLIRLASFYLIMLLDVFGALMAVVPLIFITIPKHSGENVPSENNQLRKLLRDVAEGFIYIKKWVGARGMLVVSTTVTFIMQPFFMLVAAYVTKVLLGDEIEYGIMGAGIGLGFMTGGITLSLWKGFKRKMDTTIFGIISAGLMVFIAGLLPSARFFLIVFCFFGAGFMMPICMGPMQSLIQSSVKPELQGRVFANMFCISKLITPISLGLAGFVYDYYSPRIWFLAGGILVICTGSISLCIKNIRNIGKAPA